MAIDSNGGSSHAWAVHCGMLYSEIRVLEFGKTRLFAIVCAGSAFWEDGTIQTPGSRVVSL
jgi:hypothetical protein